MGTSTSTDSDQLPVQDQSPQDPSSSSRWGVLRHAHFRTFWFAAFGSFLGNWFEFIGVQWLVAQETGSTLWLSNIGAAQLAPSLFLGMFGGIVADRVNRKRLLIATQFVMMLIAVAFALAVWRGQATKWVLLMLALAQGITIAFNSPAWQVMIPRLVPRDELVRAITLQGISFNIARAVGPAIAGIIMWWWGATWLFAINAISFIGVMLAVTTTPDAPAPARDGRSLFDIRTIWNDTRDALAYIFLQPGPRAALLAIVVFSMFATPVLRFLPLFISRVYHLEEKTFGVMTGLMGIGAVVGGLLMRYIPKWYPQHHFIPVSVLMGGLFILLFSLASNVWTAGVFMLFVGLFWMWAFNSSFSALQMLVEDVRRGRVMAVVNMVSLGFMPLGAFIASAMGEPSAAWIRSNHPELWDDGLSTQIGVAFVSMVLVGAGFVMLTWRTPEIDGLKPGDRGFDRKPGFWLGLTARAHHPLAVPVRCSECNSVVMGMPVTDGEVLCQKCSDEPRCAT